MTTRFLPLLAAVCLAATAQGAAAEACKYVNVGELPLRFQGNNFQPVVQGTINEAPATMLVDTGAYASALTAPAVERLDLQARITGNHTEGIGGASREYGVRLSEFGIGPSHAKRIGLRMIGDMGATPDYDAIVGADFLFQADVEIALADKALRFFQPLNCNNDSFLAYWAKDAVVVPLTGRFGNSKNNTFTVELNGVKLDAIIDTGASRTTVFERAARKAGVAADHESSRKAGFAVGVGSEVVAQRSAVFTTFAVGGETIRDAELFITRDLNVPGMQVDMLLGADFLRAHRVLFAMSQRQLYISYLGGEVFTRDEKGIPDWLQREADSGNPDALLALATRYAQGKLVPRDAAKAVALLEQAAVSNHRPSLLALADVRMRSKRYAEGAELYSRAVALTPDERRLWLLLYLARLRAGQTEQANSELAQRVATDRKHVWPAPVADYFLGRIDANALLAAASQDSDQAAPRRCQVNGYMGQLAASRGDTAQVKALSEARAQACKTPAS